MSTTAAHPPTPDARTGQRPTASPAPAASTPRRPLSTVQATLLVAEREIVTQVRSKAFLVTTAITLLAIVVGIVLTSVLGTNAPQSARVAVVQGAELPQQEPAASPVPSGGLEPVDVADEAQAEQMLRDGDVDAIVSPAPEDPTGVRITGLDSPPWQVVDQLSTTPAVDLLEPGGTDEVLRYIIPVVFGALFMILVLGSGAMIVQNTVQEKQSRVVEILLSTISARALLAGKILGNAAIAVGQALVYGVVTIAALTLMGQGAIVTLVLGSLGWFAVFFLPGFVLVAAMFAASASLVSRQEDAGTVMTPTMMLVMAPYFIVLAFQDNPLAMAIASYVPFTATVAMPVRLFFGEAAWWEPLLSLAILVLTTALVIALAARIYRGSLLHMGQRMKVGAALRAGR